MTIGVMIKDTANGAGDQMFDSSLVGRIGHSVANGSPSQRRFFKAVLPRR